MRKISLGINEVSMTRKVIGAIFGAFLVATFLTVVGYSDREDSAASHYLAELALAFSSYLPAGFAVFLLARNHSRPMADAFFITILGSALSFVLKLVFLEGPNGVPAYVAQATREGSWRPYGDLLKHAIGFTVLLSFVAFPAVALGVWGMHKLGTRRTSSTPPEAHGSSSFP